MINFQQPLTAGTVLIRERIESQNYVQGSAGWMVNQDGSAEFNDVVIRGGTVVSGTALYYDGTPALGNLIMSIAAAAGVDEFGNAYLQGATAYGPDGSINLLENDLIAEANNGSYAALTVGGASGAELALRPQDVVGATWNPGTVRTTLGASSRGGLVISSPSDETNTAVASMDFYGGGPSTNDSAILAAADRFNWNGNTEMEAPITRYNGGTFDTYTPTVTGGGAVTWTTRTGYYQQWGDWYDVVIYLVVNGAGSGASNVQITAPVSIERSTRQRMGATSEGLTAGNNGCGQLVAFTGGSGATFDRFRNSTGGNITGADLSAGALIVAQGRIRAA